MKVYSVLLVGMLSTCNTLNGAYMTDEGINIPNMPQSVMVNGKIVNLPQGPWDKKTTNEVLLKIRHSEIGNAYAVRDAQRYIRKLQYEYGKKKGAK